MVNYKKKNEKVTVEYKMPNAIAKNILKSRKGPEAKIDPQKYLVNYVNEQLNLLCHCVKVITF